MFDEAREAVNDINEYINQHTPETYLSPETDLRVSYAERIYLA